MHFFNSNGPKVGIASRQDVEQLEEILDGIVLISIRGSEESLPKIKFHFDDVLYLQFDDVDGSQYLMSDEVMMTEEQASQVAEFVRQHENASAILCHCQAGISRSSGCAAAIIKSSGADDMVIFNNYQYYPNRHVYKLVLNALMRYNAS